MFFEFSVLRIDNGNLLDQILRMFGVRTVDNKVTNLVQIVGESIKPSRSFCKLILCTLQFLEKLRLQEREF